MERASRPEILPTLWALRPTGGSSGDDPEERAQRFGAEDEEEEIVCRICERSISKPEHLFSMRSDSPYQVFPNPYGQMRRIMTLRQAWGLSYQGPAVTEYTWFSGYAWTIASCARCSSHIGWRFDGTGAPTRFFGLLEEALKRP